MTDRKRKYTSEENQLIKKLIKEGDFDAIKKLYDSIENDCPLMSLPDELIFRIYSLNPFELYPLSKVNRRMFYLLCLRFEANRKVVQKYIERVFLDSRMLIMGYYPRCVNFYIDALRFEKKWDIYSPKKMLIDKLKEDMTVISNLKLGPDKDQETLMAISYMVHQLNHESWKDVPYSDPYGPFWITYQRIYDGIVAWNKRPNFYLSNGTGVTMGIRL
jgi:hypothetical protein